LNFYHVLRGTVAGWAVVCPKVSLGDLLFAQTGDYSQNRSWMNRVDRKHVDFLLCDPKTMRPLLGIELDDASHQQPDRAERDQFVERVFAAARLPLARVSARAEYNTHDLESCLRSRAGIPEAPPSTVASPQGAEPGETGSPQFSNSSPLSTSTSPSCPRCGTAMVLRVVKKEGPYKGKSFWGCPNFPKCRGFREIGDVPSARV
jgi:hypothetical protein